MVNRLAWIVAITLGLLWASSSPVGRATPSVCRSPRPHWAGRRTTPEMGWSPVWSGGSRRRRSGSPRHYADINGLSGPRRHAFRSDPILTVSSSITIRVSQMLWINPLTHDDARTQSCATDGRR